MKMRMSESTSYQYILNRGAMEILRYQANYRLGTCSPEQSKRLECVDERRTIDTLSERILDASNWDEFLEGI